MRSIFAGGRRQYPRANEVLFVGPLGIADVGIRPGVGGFGVIVVRRERYVQ